MYRVAARRCAGNPLLYIESEQGNSTGSGCHPGRRPQRCRLMPPRAVVHAILAAVSLAAFLWLLTAVVSGSPLVLAFDWQVRSWIHQHAVGAVTAAMKLITVFGSVSWVLTCTTLAFLMLRKDGQPRAALV